VKKGVRIIKNDVLLEGVSWCLNMTDQHETILKAKYKKGQLCTIKTQKANPDKGNIYAGGNALIGFLNEIDFSWVKEKRILGEKVYAEIVKVSDMEEYPNSQVTLRMQTSPFVRKTIIKAKHKVAPTIASPIVIKAPRSAKIKHPITQKAFLAQKDLRSVCRNLSDRTGIYCIYTKEFTTYIGQSKDIGTRLRNHINDLKSGRHKNTQMQNDWNEHGIGYFTFQQVELCDLSKLDEREFYYIQAYKTFEYGYNATEDGQGKFDQREMMASEVDGYDENLSENEDVLEVINNYFKEAIELDTTNIDPPQDLERNDVLLLPVVNHPVDIQNETVTVDPTISEHNQENSTLLGQSSQTRAGNRKNNLTRNTHTSKTPLWESNNEVLFKELEAKGLLILQQAGTWRVRFSMLSQKVFGGQCLSSLALYNQTQKLKNKLDSRKNKLSPPNVTSIKSLIKQIETRLSQRA
jgi:group I intron endonuclease